MTANFSHDLETAMTMQQSVTRTETTPASSLSLPVLRGAHATLRELRAGDAASLFELLTAPEVARFIAEPPTTVEGFEQFIARVNFQRSGGKYACFAVTLKDDDTAIGLFQLRELEPGFKTAEWGFAIGSMFWGTGLFQESARLLLEFAFGQLGIHRLEARAAVRNGRGGRALQKVGAVPEGVLRKSFRRSGQYLDQVLYAIVEDDWRAARETRSRALPLAH